MEIKLLKEGDSLCVGRLYLGVLKDNGKKYVVYINLRQSDQIVHQALLGKKLKQLEQNDDCKPHTPINY